MQALFERLGSTGLFDRCALVPDPNQSSPELQFLGSICRLNRLVQLAEAMLLAVEALAAQECSRLPALWLSRLYEAYAKTFRSLREVRTAAGAARLAGVIGGDIACLLDCVEASGEEDLSALPEVGRLRKIFDAHYYWVDDRLSTGSALSGPVHRQPIRPGRTPSTPRPDKRESRSLRGGPAPPEAPGL